MRKHCRYADGYSAGTSEDLHTCRGTDGLEAMARQELVYVASYIGRSYWLGYLRGLRGCQDAGREHRRSIARQRARNRAMG